MVFYIIIVLNSATVLPGTPDIKEFLLFPNNYYKVLTFNSSEDRIDFVRWYNYEAKLKPSDFDDTDKINELDQKIYEKARIYKSTVYENIDGELVKNTNI